MSNHAKPAHTSPFRRDPSSMELRDDRFRLVVEAAPNAIIVTNVDGKIELVNRQAEQLFGYTRSELLGKQVEMLIPDRFRHHHPGLRSHFMENSSTRSMGAGRDLYACTKHGQEIPIEIGLNPIQTDDGMLVLSSIIDIRERKAAEQRFREQTEQIAAASRYKSEFLANMSHELRTPLNSILILSEQLKNNIMDNLTAKQVMHADIIYRSGADLLALINDILDLSKIEAGRMTVMVDKILVAEFAKSIERSFRPMAESKHLSFGVTVDSDVPDILASDHQRVFQIIRNLISNALKFTTEGSICIYFSITDGDQESLSIGVTDTGIGIPEDKHAMIFDAFRQVDGSTSRRFGGTGLGLSISRALAQLLGGEIYLRSELGQGSTFTLKLPLSLSMPPEPTHAPSERIVTPAEPVAISALGISKPAGVSLTDASAAPALNRVTIEIDRHFLGKRLLLVDDDVRNIYAMSSILEELGFDIEVAKNGKLAMDMLDSDKQIDLVLMDMMMPVMDGYEATSELKHHRQFNKPIIALTAHAMKGDREKCLAAGADDYLAKPVTKEEIIDMLRKWLAPQKVMA